MSAGRRPLPCCVLRTYTFYFRTTVSTQQQMAARADASCAYASSLCVVSSRVIEIPCDEWTNERHGEPRRRGSFRGDARCRGRGRGRRSRHRSLAPPPPLPPPRQRCVDVRPYARVHISSFALLTLMPCVASRQSDLSEDDNVAVVEKSIALSVIVLTVHGAVYRHALPSHFPAPESLESCQE